MSPELIKAISERIEQSQSKETIRDQVLAQGHSPEVFEAAYVAALSEVKTAVIDHAHAETPLLTTRDLPRVATLVKDSFSFTRNHLFLAALLAAPLVISYITTEISTYYADNEVLSIAAGSVAVVAMLGYFFNFAAVLYYVGKVKRGEAGLKAAFSFARKHFFSLMGIYILSMLALWGGFFLFVIPGIILYTTLYFAPFVLLNEEKRGMDALLGSRALVKGRWMVITLKLLKYVIVVFFPLLFVSGMYTAITEVVGWGSWSILAGEMVLETLMAFAAVMNLFAVNELYHALTLTMTPSVPESGARTRYWLLVGVGVLAFVALVAALIYATQEGMLEELPIEDPLALQPLLYDAEGQAAAYYTEHGSYEGVCDTLTAAASELMATECNDQADKWAFSVSNGIDTWCADTETTAKRINGTLGERVECLNLPE